MKSRIGIVAGLLLLGLLMLAPAPLVLAQGVPPSGMRRHERMMHHEMAAACMHKAQGAPCSFLREGKTISGTCYRARRGHLVCHSNHMHGHQRHGHMGGMPSNMPPQ